jgi:hypothetical protein
MQRGCGKTVETDTALLTKHEEKSINYPPLKNVFDGKYL